jgi:hypothetical protein
MNFDDQPRGAASTRGVGTDVTDRLYSSAGGHGAAGLACRQCGWTLQPTSLGEGDAGALHQHLRCTACGAHGCLSTNMPGAKAICERGRALEGER